MSAAGVLPRQIASALCLADPEILLTVQDIYNEHKLICLEKLAGQSLIEALFYELQQGNFFIGHKTHLDGNVTHLFFASPASIELWKCYSEVLLMDCTYKTNRFNMPLLNIMGSTGLNTSFFIGFAFLSSEMDKDYIWALNALKDIM